MFGPHRVDHFRGLLPRYYLFRVTNTSGFFLPVSIIVLQDKGFDLGFIGLAYGVYAAAKLAAEIPTGYAGDLLGRRTSLAVGSIVRAFVIGSYPFINSTEAYLAVHVLWAVGRTFQSGTQNAWLYEILQARFDEDQFARIESRGNTAKLLTDSVTAITGGVLYSIDVAYPFVGTALIALVGVPVLYSFPSVDDLILDTGDDIEETQTLTVRRAVRLLRVQVWKPNIRWFVLFSAVFYSLFVVTRIYEQPALDVIGVSVVEFGVLYAGFKLFSAVAASGVGRVHDLLGTEGVLAAMVPIYAVAYASIAVVPALVVPVLFVNRGLHTITSPVTNQYLNAHIDDMGRATVLSGAWMILALVGSGARVLAGRATEMFGPVGFLPWAGVGLSILGAVVWVLTSPVRTHADNEASRQAEGFAPN